MAILGVFGKLCFSPFLVTKTQMCLTGSITSENKGGGSDPLRKKSIGNLLFFLMASLTYLNHEGVCRTALATPGLFIIF